MTSSATCGYCGETSNNLKSCVCSALFYCTKICQKKHWKVHRFACPPFSKKGTGVGSKGRGLFATRGLNPGVVILREDPILSADINCNDDDQLLKSFKSLPSEKQAEILNLHDPCPEDKQGLLRKIKRIMDVNCCRSSKKLQNTVKKNLYVTNAFINHSCKPNCCWKPSEESETMAVVTMTPIMKGEEITVNYFFTIADERGEFCLSRESRRRKINELFNFDCLCSECSQPREENDKMRLQYQRLDRQLEVGFEDLESTRRVFEVAEVKLDLGTKLDAQVLLRDLMDCLIPLKCLLDIDPDQDRRGEYVHRFQELNRMLKGAATAYPERFINDILPFVSSTSSS